MATSETFYAGWILHRRAYRNSSLIVDCYTEQHGRVGMVARGGRKDPLLQPFRPLQFLFKGHGELKTLMRCEPAGPAIGIVGEGLYCGLYLNELLTRLLHRDDPSNSLLALYAETLAGLAQEPEGREVLLRNFEFRLLDTLGYGFSLQHDVEAKSISASALYRLEPDQGLVMDACGEFSGEDLLALAVGDWRLPVRRTARNLMRRALAPHLGEKPLASRELFRGMKTTNREKQT